MTDQNDDYLQQFVSTYNATMIGIQERISLLEGQPKAVDRSDLYAALAIAQGEIRAAETNQEAEVRKKDDYSKVLYTFKYADLASCLEAVRKPLSDNGLALIQIPSLGEGGAIHMRTVIGHSSGQSISCEMTMYPDNNKPQSIGTCMAYLRRYSLCAMIGVAQFDDDGKIASEGRSANDYERITAEEAEKVVVTAHNLFGADDDKVVARMLKGVFSTSELSITAIPDLPAGCADQAITALKNQAKREKAEAKKTSSSKDQDE